MFGKLMKYNVKEVGMVMVPMYAALLILGLAAGLATKFSLLKGAGEIVTSTVPGVLTLLLFMTFGIMGLATGIVTLVMIVRNFRENLLGNRGYLTNSLPVSTASHILSKTVSGVIFICLGGVAATLAGLIFLGLNLSGKDWSEIWTSLNTVTASRISVWLTFAQILLMVLVWMVQIVAKLYVSISLGNLWRPHRTMGGILLFVGLTVGQNFIGNRMSHISSDASLGYSLMGAGVRAVFGSFGTFDGIEMMEGILTAKQMAFFLGINGAYILVFLLVTVWVLNKKLDLQ